MVTSKDVTYSHCEPIFRYKPVLMTDMLWTVVNINLDSHIVYRRNICKNYVAGLGLIIYYKNN